jgi:hypothetical protein
MPYGWEGEKVRLVPLDKARQVDPHARESWLPRGRPHPRRLWKRGAFRDVVILVVERDGLTADRSS